MYILSAKTGKIADHVYSIPFLFVFGKGMKRDLTEKWKKLNLVSEVAKKYWVLEEDEIKNAVIVGFDLDMKRNISLIYGDLNDNRVQKLRDKAYEEWVVLKNGLATAVRKLDRFAKKIGGEKDVVQSSDE